MVLLPSLAVFKSASKSAPFALLFQLPSKKVKPGYDFLNARLYKFLSISHLLKRGPIQKNCH